MRGDSGAVVSRLPKPMNQPLGGTDKKICLAVEMKGTAINLVEGRERQLNIFVNKAVSYTS